MGNYRITAPISVMVRQDGTHYVSHTLPKGTVISITEPPVNLTRHIVVQWDGKNALMFARDLLTHAERTPAEE